MKEPFYRATDIERTLLHLLKMFESGRVWIGVAEIQNWREECLQEIRLAKEPNPEAM